MVKDKEVCRDVINTSRSLLMVSELLQTINSLCDGNCDINAYCDNKNKELLDDLSYPNISLYRQGYEYNEYVSNGLLFYVSQEELEDLKNGEYVVTEKREKFGNFLQNNLSKNKDFFDKLNKFIVEKSIANNGKKFNIYGLVQIKHIKFSDNLILDNEMSAKLRDSSICIYKVTIIDDIYDRENMSDPTDTESDKVHKIRVYADESDFIYLGATIEKNNNIACMIKHNYINYYMSKGDIETKNDFKLIKKANFQSTLFLFNEAKILQNDEHKFTSSLLTQFKNVQHDSVKITADVVNCLPTFSIKIYLNDNMLIDYTINSSDKYYCEYANNLFHRLVLLFNLTTSDLVLKNINLNKSELSQNWGEW